MYIATFKDKVCDIIEKYMPLLFDWYNWKAGNNDKWAIRKDVLRYYKSRKGGNKEIDEAVNFIKKRGLKVFPYKFIDKYDPDKIKVHTNDISGIRYVMHEGEKLFFPRPMQRYVIRRVYTSLLREQDPDSPHRYLTPEFNVEEGDVIIDIGAAEGNFSLSAVHKAKRIYLFEMDPIWQNALERTFEPWKEKVKIINKYVSDTDSEDTMRLDTLLEELIDENLFIKIDVEGAEKKVLDGAEKILEKEGTKAIVCTYHYQNDYDELSSIMKKKKYNIETSPGYMLFHIFGVDAPYFRKGLIRCRKNA